MIKFYEIVNVFSGIFLLVTVLIPEKAGCLRADIATAWHSHEKAGSKDELLK